jgi:hypothetical protein
MLLFNSKFCEQQIVSMFIFLDTETIGTNLDEDIDYTVKYNLGILQ